MSNTHEFCPDWASAPGDTIVDILRERALSKGEFAKQIGATPEDVDALLEGRATISITIARSLARVLGASVEFWVARDFQYRQDVARLDATNQEWLSELPLGDMIRFGWLKSAPHPSQEVDACLRFFNVSSVRAWHEKYASLQQMAAFRTSPSLDSRPAAVAAWLRQGEIEASMINCRPWNAEQFQESLPYIRSLTRKKEPSEFIPQLQKICAESGVAVAIVRSPSGCRASGATRFLTRDKALLMLSFRYLTDDHFWFTFFHEAGHLLLHGERGFFLEGTDTTSTAQETEANEFAARSLIPSEFQSALLELPLNAREVIRFGKHVGVSPGIIVGQLQHLRKIKHNQLNSLKRRFRWEE